MENRQNKIGYSILGIVALILLVVFTSLAIFSYSEAGTTANKITSGTVTMSYQESEAGITITNAYPITDEEGKVLAQEDASKGVSNGYFDFNVSATMTANTTIQYDIYAKNVSSSPSLGEEFVKVYLTDGTAGENPYTGYDSSVPLFSTLPQVSDDASSKILYSGTLTSTNLTQAFRLRMWVASTFQDASVNRNFKIRVGVKATQVAQ